VTAATTWLAPAKVNLFLHVVGRRDDGYHRIQSAMQLIDLADTLTIAPRDDGRIERTVDLPGVAVDADLSIRAARLLQAASGTAFGASIGVEKRIPQGGGLGGGSSDAATTLLALNRLWKLDWPRQRLMALGLELGADVPFFVGGGDAFVEGIGERLTPVALPEARYAVVHPGVAVPTAAIFSAGELTRDSPTLKISDFAKCVSSVLAEDASSAQRRSPDEGGVARGRTIFRNDLEPVAVARFEAVRDALRWLARRDDGSDWPGADGVARMSGSGACVFRPFVSAETAAACIAELPPAWSGWSVRSLAVHPHRDCAPD
jgi:4-diphosphocytidyl-2-C-methyl-D-erythritol kinase